MKNVVIRSQIISTAMGLTCVKNAKKSESNNRIGSSLVLTFTFDIFTTLNQSVKKHKSICTEVGTNLWYVHN